MAKKTKNAASPPPIAEDNPRRRRRRRSRRRNPQKNIDGRSALGLGLVGGAIGGIAAVVSSRAGSTWKEVALGVGTGGVIGAVLGAFLPKSGRHNNPSLNPAQNPLGVTTAVIAGTALALIPTAVKAEVSALERLGQRAPTIKGMLGSREFDVGHSGSTWAWRFALTGQGGAADSRSAAIEAAFDELVKTADDLDDIELLFQPQGHIVTVSPIETGEGRMWRWSAPNGTGGDAETREEALSSVLRWSDEHSELN